MTTLPSYVGFYFEPSETELLQKLTDMAEVNHYPLSRMIKEALSRFLQDHYPNFPEIEATNDEEDED